VNVAEILKNYGLFNLFTRNKNDHRYQLQSLVFTMKFTIIAAAVFMAVPSFVTAATAAAADSCNRGGVYCGQSLLNKGMQANSECICLINWRQETTMTTLFRHSRTPANQLMRPTLIRSFLALVSIF
jgi:hypothetical protein